MGEREGPRGRRKRRRKGWDEKLNQRKRKVWRGRGADDSVS